MTRKILISSLLVGVVGALCAAAQAQSARDSITIVGSSTVYPFTTTVAEQFGRQGKFKTPKVESTGTGGGLKLFCNGVGPQFPDIANASRRIRPAELQTCAQNGVKDVVEVKVGYDGIVMIVVMAAGLAANLTINPLEAVTTVTVQIVTLLVGDQEFDSPKTLAAFALGLVLFLVTLALNVLALHIVRKYREQYE